MIKSRLIILITDFHYQYTPMGNSSHKYIVSQNQSNSNFLQNQRQKYYGQKAVGFQNSREAHSNLTYHSFQQKFNQVKDRLQKEMYLNPYSSIEEQELLKIEEHIKEIEIQKQHMSKFKQEQAIQFMQYTYQKVKFYHFRAYQNTALKCIQQLLAMSSSQLNKAKMSRLNLNIFQYLITTCLFNQAESIQVHNLSWARQQCMNLMDSLHFFRSMFQQCLELLT